MIRWSGLRRRVTEWVGCEARMGPASGVYVAACSPAVLQGVPDYREGAIVAPLTATTVYI